MYLVTFRLRPGEYDDEFRELNAAVERAAETTPGYAGRRVWESPDGAETLVVYRWETLEALAAFAADEDHREAKRRWAEWYEEYEVTVAEVVDTYGNGR
ncbi:antibiotic biosynthesis monooxygenase family protein [Halosegnis marinus]|uniref:Antibiotic biosynthesis monooxygenase family protein n=1 Tax=Halosegnis marinus TaxID=3034023 RepID=A0ABD5ZMB1_9EURY|nr:antibiotic biosynthesis monooxygenase [Halosegnis sp. DT85]